MTPPHGYHNVTPTLCVPGAAKLIAFLEEVFQAEEIERYLGPDGAIMHAELRIGDSIIMVGEPFLGPMPASLYVYVGDVEAAYGRALRSGATSLAEPEDQFHGARTARVKDPFGNVWAIATQIEDVSREEARRRFDALMNPGGG